MRSSAGMLVAASRSSTVQGLGAGLDRERERNNFGEMTVDWKAYFFVKP